MNTSKCTDTILFSALSAELSFTWRDWILAGKRLLVAELARVMPIIRIWDHRWVSRKHLAKLDASLLDDIGLTADQAQAEMAKPFWEK